MKRNFIIFLSLLVFVCGCSTTPQLMRRYKDAQWGPAEKDAVTTSAFAMDAPPSDPPKNLLLQLAPEGEQALIEEVGARTEGKPYKEFLDELTGQVNQKNSDTVWDKTNFKKRIVFAVGKNSIGKPTPLGIRKPLCGPADRINELVVKLKMDQKSQADFESWNRFDTHYDNVDLGKVSHTQSSTEELGMSIGSGNAIPVSVSVNPRFSRTKSIQEERVLRQRYIVLAGHIYDDKQVAELQEESVIGVDLAGTFSVDFEIKVARDQVHHKRVAVVGPLTIEDKGSPVEPGDAKIDFGLVYFKKTADPIKCQLTFDYVLRHVVNGDQELEEGLQTVIYQSGSGPASGTSEVTLVGYRDVLATVYTIAVGRVHHGQGKILSLMEEDEDQPLYFPSYDSANKFRKWLKTRKALTVSKYKLAVTEVTCKKNVRQYGPPRHLRPNEIEQLTIKAEILNPMSGKNPCNEQ